MKDAAAIRNVCEIIRKVRRPLTVVVSAIGQTTNTLEKVVEAHYRGNDEVLNLVEEIRAFHYALIEDLFGVVTLGMKRDVDRIFGELESHLEKIAGESFEFEYDQIIGIGELLSSRILSAYLKRIGQKNKWVDIRKCLKSDRTYRDANINWDYSQRLVKRNLKDEPDTLYITQGFIASDEEGYTTSLGREGSDYTASILAYLVGAEKMVIWKDVLGILNADPDYFDNTVKLDLIPYQEAIELSYYGARVIHPKTIKPLQAKLIPLWVKSFQEPEKEGTLIAGGDELLPRLPNYIVKKRQVLLTLKPLNFSFIGEKDLFFVFSLLTKYRIKLNFSQNTALSFAFCVDGSARNLEDLVRELELSFEVLKNDRLELITIRHYQPETLQEINQKHRVLIEQKNYNTAIYLVS